MMSSYDQSLSSAALKLMTYEKPTDDELYEQAAYTAEQSYQNAYNQLFNTTKSKKNILLKSIQDVESDYEKSISEMGSYFKNSAEILSDDALSRGLSRSSYALDLQNENETNRQDALRQLLSDRMETINEIQNQIDILEQEYLENQNYLSNQKSAEIEQTLSDLKDNRDQTMREVLEYNNDLILDYKDYQLDELEANRDYEIALKKLNKKTSSSSGSSKKTASRTLMDEWNSLTGPGKLKFYSENAEALKALDLDIYKNIVREIMGLKQLGVVEATTKSYNYYK